MRPPKLKPVRPEKPARPATLKPWAATPAEMLHHAAELLHASDVLQKQAFLEIDIAVELVLKGYLTESGRARQAQPRDFPEWLEAVKDAAGDALKGIDLKAIAWYHRLRNQLHHEGSGITVERKAVEVYLGIAQALLEALNSAPSPRPAAPRG